jgi:histidinol phosphatase-like enzyme (inositol monophosphatase family)
MADELGALLDFAHQIAWRAGKITLRYFQGDLAVDHKADESPVTVADRESEAFLRAAISARYPDHAILGEEEGLTGGAGASHRWILDPIDGTKSFVRGVPLYGVMVALVREGEPVLGVVNLPAMGEVVYAARGQGTWWNGRPCRVSATASLRESLVVGTIAHGYEEYGKGESFQRILKACGLFRTWGDCYGHLLVATGRAEVAIDPIMNVWDSAALFPILQEAGGTFTDWGGTPTIEGDEAFSTNGAVLQELLELTR